MKSIYDIINESKTQENVFSIVGPDDSIVAVADNEDDAEKMLAAYNKDAGGKVFVIKKEQSTELTK